MDATLATLAVGALGPLDLRRGPTQARSDLVGDDLDDGTLLALLGLVRTLLDAAGDNDPSALGERRRGVFTE